MRSSRSVARWRLDRSRRPRHCLRAVVVPRLARGRRRPRASASHGSDSPGPRWPRVVQRISQLDDPTFLTRSLSRVRGDAARLLHEQERRRDSWIPLWLRLAAVYGSRRGETDEGRDRRSDTFDRLRARRDLPPPAERAARRPKGVSADNAVRGGVLEVLSGVVHSHITPQTERSGDETSRLASISWA